MPVVGAFLGGIGGSIAAGYSDLIINWQTTDGNNLSGVVFTLTGPATYTLTTDSAGVARAMVQAGTYTVSVSVEGYTGTEPRTVVCNSRDTTTLVWIATKVYRQQVTILTPISTVLSYEIVNVDGEIEYSGENVDWASSMPFQLYPGDYTLNLEQNGETQSMDFDVGNEARTVDVSSLFCRVTVDFGIDYPVKITCNGVIYSSPFYLLKSNSSKTLTFSDEPRYSGLSTESIMTFQDIDITPNLDSISATPVGVGRILTLSSAGDLSIPATASFRILAIGGGGGGSGGSESNNCGGGGGGSGYISQKTVELDAGSYPLTIGSGGSGSTGKGSSGGATSFGTVISCSGGGGGSYNSISGGTGGSGGGGGGSNTSNGGQDGGDGYFGGGGGGGGNTNTGYGYGGTGGKFYSRYGGDGQSGGDYRVSAYSGASGTKLSDDFYGTASANGGSGSGNYGGGGGGGGLNAAGGSGGTGGHGSGGGGGGGVAGGSGGTGGNGATSSGVGGGRGRGYGAGGGGGAYSKVNSTGCVGGGGGGGGLGTAYIAGSGGNISVGGGSGSGGSGAQGAIRIQWVRV